MKYFEVDPRGWWVNFDQEKCCITWKTLWRVATSANVHDSSIPIPISLPLQSVFWGFAISLGSWTHKGSQECSSNRFCKMNMLLVEKLSKSSWITSSIGCKDVAAWAPIVPRAEKYLCLLQDGRVNECSLIAWAHGFFIVHALIPSYNELLASNA